MHVIKNLLNKTFSIFLNKSANLDKKEKNLKKVVTILKSKGAPLTVSFKIKCLEEVNFHPLAVKLAIKNLSKNSIQEILKKSKSFYKK